MAELDSNFTEDDRAYRKNILNIPANQFHPLVFIGGEPEFGDGVYVGLFSEINASGARIVIGSNCDIASFVSINVADSHLHCIGKRSDVVRQDIILGDRVFVGTHSVILGGSIIGARSVIAAGTIVRGLEVPPDSLVIGNPAICHPSYYLKRPHEDSTAKLITGDPA